MLNQFLHDALFETLFGWTNLIPMELWWIAGGIAALVMLRFLGWEGVVGLAAAVAYYLGLKRGIEIEKASEPKPAPRPASRVPNTPAKQPTIFDRLRGR